MIDRLEDAFYGHLSNCERWKDVRNFPAVIFDDSPGVAPEAEGEEWRTEMKTAAATPTTTTRHDEILDIRAG